LEVQESGESQPCRASADNRDLGFEGWRHCFESRGWWTHEICWGEGRGIYISSQRNGWLMTLSRSEE
jgi:hypothetical protein